MLHAYQSCTAFLQNFSGISQNFNGFDRGDVKMIIFQRSLRTLLLQRYNQIVRKSSENALQKFLGICEKGWVVEIPPVVQYALGTPTY